MDFEKTGIPGDIAIERTKTMAARRIAEETGLFYVPLVVGHDNPGALSLEWLDGLTRLSTIVEAGGAHAVFERLGSAIASIHQRLDLPSQMRLPLPAPWGPDNGLGDPVFVHGDLTTYNVCLQEDTDRLVILDWSTAPHLGTRGTFGSPYFDVALLFANCSYTPSAKAGALSLSPCFESFLTGYASTAEKGLSRNVLKTALTAIESEYLRQVAHGARLRAPMARIAYSAVQRRRLGAWRRYRESLVSQ